MSLGWAVLCCAVLCCTALRSAVLCCSVICYAMLAWLSGLGQSWAEMSRLSSAQVSQMTEAVTQP